MAEKSRSVSMKMAVKSVQSAAAQSAAFSNAAAQAPMDDEFEIIRIPHVGHGIPMGRLILATGFKDIPFPTCATPYFIESAQTSEMQILRVALNKYQEVLSESHHALSYRAPSIALSRGFFGMRFKNMSGTDGFELSLTPGFNAKILPIDLSEHPELCIKPEQFFASFDGNMRREWEIRVGLPKFPLPFYHSLRGVGVVFLRMGGRSLFRSLAENEVISVAIPNLTAFQTFCDLEVVALDNPTSVSCGMFGAPAPVFPHVRVKGPGLVCISALFHEENIYPFDLDEFPGLIINPSVFMAASDTNISFTAEKLAQQGSKIPTGRVVVRVGGKGLLFLKLAGIVRIRRLEALQTVYLSTATMAAFQGSCKVVEEPLPAPPAREFKDMKITGPGLVVMQSANTQDKTLPHPENPSIGKPSKEQLKHAALEEKQRAAGGNHDHLSMRPQASPEMIEDTREATERRQQLALRNAATQDFQLNNMPAKTQQKMLNDKASE